MPSGLPRVALLGAFTFSCSPAEDPPAAEEVEKTTPSTTDRAALSTTDAGVDAGLLLPASREEIWRLGVERFGWRGDGPPADASKEELIEFFRTDARIEDYVDPVRD